MFQEKDAARRHCTHPPLHELWRGLTGVKKCVQFLGLRVSLHVQSKSAVCCNNTTATTHSKAAYKLGLGLADQSNNPHAMCLRSPRRLIEGLIAACMWNVQLQQIVQIKTEKFELGLATFELSLSIA